MNLHAFNQRILAEDLVRVRNPDDRERYAMRNAQARFDPKPHQIDAVFALRFDVFAKAAAFSQTRVGLGKTD